MWDETGCAFCVRDWPFWHIPSLGKWILQPEPDVEPRAQLILSWSISQGSLQGSVTLEAAWMPAQPPVHLPQDTQCCSSQLP